MEYYKQMLCVTFEELTTGDEPVIKKKTLFSRVDRGSIQNARQGKGEGNYALYVYSSLPPKYRQRFEEKYGNPEEIMKEKEAASAATVLMSGEAREYYESFEYSLNGVQTRLSEKLIQEYTINASVMAMLWDRMNRLVSTSHALCNGRRGDLWDIVFNESES